jgi:hypothetical protein
MAKCGKEDAQNMYRPARSAQSLNRTGLGLKIALGAPASRSYDVGLSRRAMVVVGAPPGTGGGRRNEPQGECSAIFLEGDGAACLSVAGSTGAAESHAVASPGGRRGGFSWKSLGRCRESRHAM